MPNPLDPGALRTKFEQELGKFRREMLIFSVTTIFVAPALAGILVVLGFIVAYGNSRQRDRFDDLNRDMDRLLAVSPVTVMNVLLIAMFAALFMRPKGRGRMGGRDMIWVGAAAAVMVLVLGLSYGTSLSESTPGLFWTLYGVLAIVVLGLLGHAYEPADDYYLGWYGMSDDPFTLRDDVDRSHMTLGFIVALPRVIVGSFGTIFGSSWLIRGLDSAEIYGAASVLHALGEQRVEEAEQKLRFAGEKSAARILRALDKMEYVRPDGGHLRLTSKGERLVGVSDVL